MIRKPFAVVFAGVPGSSKTIIAHYLSIKFCLPVFSNDNLRYEVKEDMLIHELVLPEDLVRKGINEPKALAEFEKRLTGRMDEALEAGRPIIIDGSIDRRWPERKKQLQKNGYGWFMINLELSKPFLKNLLKGTGREHFLPQLEGYFEQHQKFISEYGDEVGLYIRDSDFPDRLGVSAEALREFIDARG